MLEGMLEGVLQAEGILQQREVWIYIKHMKALEKVKLRVKIKDFFLLLITLKYKFIENSVFEGL